MPILENHWSEVARGLTSPQGASRLRAAKELGKLGPSAIPAIPSLIAVLEDPEQSVREAAVQAVGQFGPAAIPTLIQFLSHSDKYVRRNSTWCLAKLGAAARPAMAALCAALHDSDPRTASGAAQALGNMGATAAPAVPALTEAMRGTNVVLCRLASKALSQIGQPAVATLLAHLRHHDPFVRGEAATALGWIGAPAVAAVPVLVEMVLAGAPPTPPPVDFSRLNELHDATPLSAGAETLTSTGDETTRLAAVTALGRLGPCASEAIPILNAVATEQNEQIRTAAELALRQIQGY